MAIENSTGKTPSHEAMKLNDREEQLLEAFQLMPENHKAHMVRWLEDFTALPAEDRTNVKMLQIAVDLAPDFALGKEQIDSFKAQLEEALNKEVVE